MAIGLNDNLDHRHPKAADDRTGKFVTGVWLPYSTTDEANTLIEPLFRHRGLIVQISVSGVINEYWYRDGIADIDLIIKPVGRLFGLDDITTTTDRTVDMGTHNLVLNNINGLYIRNASSQSMVRLFNDTGLLSGSLTVYKPSTSAYSAMLPGTITLANDAGFVGSIKSTNLTSLHLPVLQLPNALTGQYTIPISINGTIADTAGNITVVIPGSAGGSISFSPNGILTQFSIPHGLAYNPTMPMVVAASQDATDFYITKDATNIYVRYSVAPPAGSNTLSFYWTASGEPVSAP